MTANRRRPRGVRPTAAVALLVGSGLLLVAALAVGARPLLGAAGVLVWVAGVAAARLLSDERVRTLREAAHDRAVQARAYADAFTARAREHDAFAVTMAGRVAARDAEILRLSDQVRRAAEELVQAQSSAREEAARADSLQAALSRLEARVAELSDDLDEQKSLASESLAFWYGRHDPSVAELVEWENRRLA